METPTKELLNKLHHKGYTVLVQKYDSIGKEPVWKPVKIEHDDYDSFKGKLPESQPCHPIVELLNDYVDFGMIGKIDMPL